jgi:hypothetical protein
MNHRVRRAILALIVILLGSWIPGINAQQQNAEHALFSRCEPLAARGTANWQAHAWHSGPYVGRGVAR